jgi:hypothetical protein
MQVVAHILTSLGAEFTVTGKTRGEAIAAAVELLDEGETIVNTEFRPYYPDRLTVAFVMDGRQQEINFNYLSAFNLFLRNNKRRIYGIKFMANSGRNGDKIATIMRMHGVGFIR